MANVLLDLIRQMALNSAANKVEQETGIGQKIMDAIIPPAAASDASAIPQLLPADTVLTPEQEQMVMNRIATEAPERPRQVGRTYLPDIVMQEPTQPAMVDLVEQQNRQRELDNLIAAENASTTQDFVRQFAPIADLPDEQELMKQLDPAKLEAKGITPQKAYELTQAAGVLNLVPEVDRVARETGNDSIFDGFTDKIKNVFGDEKKMLTLAMAFNTLRYKPDASLSAFLGKRIETLDAKAGGNQTIAALRAKGVDEATLTALAKSPELLKAVATKVFTKGFADSSAEQRFFEELTKDMSEEDRQKAIDIKLGLKPRAGSQYAQTLQQLIAWEEAKKYGGKKGTTKAEEEAAAAKNAKAFSTYEAGMKSLERDLLGTTTGYFAGMLPAITSSQQSADMAINRMAPLLKNIFRESGEGVFTDRDQELLIGMIPTRGTNPDVIANSIKAINDIVRLKLSGTGMSTPATGATGGSRIRYDAQGNRIQ